LVEILRASDVDQVAAGVEELVGARSRRHPVEERLVEGEPRQIGRRVRFETDA